MNLDELPKDVIIKIIRSIVDTINEKYIPLKYGFVQELERLKKICIEEELDFRHCYVQGCEFLAHDTHIINLDTNLPEGCHFCHRPTCIDHCMESSDGSYHCLDCSHKCEDCNSK